MTDEQNIRKAAAHWLATLHSGNVDPGSEEEFLRWLASDERHAQSVTQLYARISTFKTSPLRALDPEHLAATLAAPSRRRFLRGALIITGTALGGWLLTHTGSTGIAMPGDLYSGIGERRGFKLDDGSSLKLNAVSRVSSDYRRLYLHQGEILLDIAPSTGTEFTVLTEFCCICSTGKTMLVRQAKDCCYVLAVDGALIITTVELDSFTLMSRQWISVSHEGIVTRGHEEGGETSWLHGLLTAEHRPLEEVLERLRPYHYGVIHLDPVIAQLSVSGTFPLDNVHHSLEMLAAAFPIKTVEHTSAWISIVPV